MLASGSRKGHRGEEGEAAVERKAVLGGRGGALACPVVAEGGARDLPEASTFRKPEGLRMGRCPRGFLLLTIS